ncbi:hypothetical protein [Tenacibaculum sp. SDUM215027]|uniref:hypothetical protein n=1 Tax=Tenacibaculum sp. SDUM215027 TaxID=3422596 RepID=UPI003D31DA92
MLKKLFHKKKLSDIYSNYEKNLRQGKDFFEGITLNRKKYKTQVLKLFREAIENKDNDKLAFCITVCFYDGTDNEYIDFFEEIILADWHEEHEDVVDIVRSFKDDRFTESLKEIAVKEEIYRKYDDENESTLRKCVHALKAINSPKSNQIIKELIDSGNENVRYALENYKD